MIRTFAIVAVVAVIAFVALTIVKDSVATGKAVATKISARQAALEAAMDAK